MNEKPRYKNSGTIFWGVFLISAGVLFLLQNFNVIDMTIGWLGDFWPLVLIIWGASLLKIPDSIKIVLAGASGLILAMIIVSIVSGGFRFASDMKDEVTETISENINSIDEKKEYIVENNDSVQQVSFNISAGVCELSLADTTSELVKVYTNSLSSSLSSDIDSSENQAYIDFQAGVNRRKGKEINIFMNPKPLWDIRISSGASDIDCDLSYFKISNIDIEAGATDLDVTLGSLSDTTNISIETGASDIIFQIPEDATCLVEVETVLSDKDFEGFTNIGNGAYESKGKDGGSYIFIEYHGAIGDFTIKRLKSESKED